MQIMSMGLLIAWPVRYPSDLDDCIKVPVHEQNVCGLLMKSSLFGLKGDQCVISISAHKTVGTG